MIHSLTSRFRVPQIKLAPLAGVLLLLITANTLLGQTNGVRGKNNPYSPSPSPKVKHEEPVSTPIKSGPTEVSFIMQGQVTPPKQESRPTVAQTTFKIAKSADLRRAPPSEIYKIGVGDVLFVNLKSSAQASGYYTVRPDGTIDFPLAGENVIVADQTVDSIEDILASGITLFADPQVEVKVREYSSHKITVSGMVERPGEKSLQREAIPLFVIRAEAVVDSRASKALITRATLLKVESYDLRNADSDNVLIYPGNSVEFTSENGNSRSTGIGFYFISGEVFSGGQKELSSGLTLYQAIAASGGAKGNPKKAIIRRKNESGAFSVIEHKLSTIRDGKGVDPVLYAGDVIEVRN